MKKSNVLVIILSALVVVMGAYLVYDKLIVSNEKNNDKELNEEKKNENNNIENDLDSNENNDKNIESNVSTCYGTYYGKAKGTLNNGLSYDYEYKYVLNNDNTYSATFGEEKTSGTYEIIGGKINFMHKPEVGDYNQTINDTYDISDDCSYIVIDNEIDFKLFKQ